MVGRKRMHTLDRVLMFLGGAIISLSLIYSAYLFGFARALEEPFSAPQFLWIGLLLGVIVYGVGFFVEAMSKSILNDKHRQDQHG